MIAEKPMVEALAECVDVPVGFCSVASARAVAQIARGYAGGRVHVDAREGASIRSVPAGQVEGLNATLDRAIGADRTTRFHVPESVGLSTVFLQQSGRMGVLVSAPTGSLSSEVIDGLAHVAERNAFDGLSTTEDGRVAILGIDPTVVTEVMAAVEHLGLMARATRHPVP